MVELVAVDFDTSVAGMEIAFGTAGYAGLLYLDGMGAWSDTVMLQPTKGSLVTSVAAGPITGAGPGDVLVAFDEFTAVYYGAPTLGIDVDPAVLPVFSVPRADNHVHATAVDASGVAPMIAHATTALGTLIQVDQGSQLASVPYPTTRGGVGDVDGDGFGELVLASADSALLVIVHGIPAVEGEIFDCYDLVMLPYQPVAIAVGDYDGDSIAEVVFTDGLTTGLYGTP